MDKVLFSNNSDEWATPIKLYNELNEEFHFTLDPCASDQNHKCDKYYTKETNGLLKSWEGEVVFCNPPYSRIKDWCYKCYLEHKKHNVTVVLLIPSRTDTAYFHDYVYHKSELRFLRGRLHFNESKNSAPFPSVVCIYKEQ